jgi:transcriptional regulator with XRE-family HTH domain
MATKTTRREWREQGPLRTWRAQQGMTLHEAAHYFGVSISTIQVLENGVQMPSDGIAHKLAIGMRTSPAAVRQRFARWMNTRP